ncbi:MAG: response regulator [Myxococcota bacterium]
MVTDVKPERGRVLVVEDDEGTRRFLERSLREEGLLVSSAGNAPEALRHLEGEPPDVILLDLTAPGSGGHAFLECLQRDPRLRDIPVVVGSNSCETYDWRPDDLGVVDVEQKPYAVAHVTRTLRRVLHHRRDAARPEAHVRW